MSDYEARSADAFQDRLRVIHKMATAPGPAVLILEQIAQLTEPGELDAIRSRALEGPTTRTEAP